MRSPIARAELASTRRRIEIADALHRVRIVPEHAEAIRRCLDQSAALGRTLRNPSTWAVNGTRGVIAAELLQLKPKTLTSNRSWTVAAG